MAGQENSSVPLRRGRRGRAGETRDAVTEMVRELLEVRRLEELTVSEIVNQAGISRQTFYAHFDTKYSVVVALIDDMGRGVFEVWRPFFEGEGPVDETLLREASAATIGLWRKQAALFIATIDGWHSSGDVHDAWNAVLDRFEAALLQRLARERELEPGDDLLAGALVAVFERSLYNAVAMPDSHFGRSDEELAAMLARLWSRALRRD